MKTLLTTIALLALSGCAAQDYFTSYSQKQAMQDNATEARIQAICDSGGIPAYECAQLKIEAITDGKAEASADAEIRRQAKREAQKAVDDYNRCIQFVDSSGFLC